MVQSDVSYVRETGIWEQNRRLNTRETDPVPGRSLASHWSYTTNYLLSLWSRGYGGTEAEDREPDQGVVVRSPDPVKSTFRFYEFRRFLN